MSVFDNNEKDNLLSEIEDFLENHKLSELMEIIRYAIENEEWKRGEE